MTCGQTAKQRLAIWLAKPTLILGVGNPWRGDDAAGPRVCAAAGSRYVVDCGDAPERELGRAADPGVAQVLIVDAMDFGGGAGELAFCRPEDLTERAGTTHTTGLAMLARYLEEAYGKPVAVLGIQPGETQFGAEMGEAVKAAVAEVSAVLVDCVASRPTTREAEWTRS